MRAKMQEKTEVTEELKQTTVVWAGQDFSSVAPPA